VVLDVLLDRKPHAHTSARLWAAVEEGRVNGLIAAHSVTTLHYLAHRARGARFAKQALQDLLTVFGVATVDEVVVRRALGLGWADFENAVSAIAAEAAGCRALVTRDPSGFADAPLPVLDPAGALALAGQSPKGRRED
jgi:hypothetical protein